MRHALLLLASITAITLLSSVVTLASAAESDPVLVGAGDIATCTNNNDEATAKLLDGIPGTVFTAGDNAYDSGTDAEFANCYDPTWGRHKARTKPTPGNHEYLTTEAAGYFKYFGTAAGEQGKGYYSFDLGEWHIIALNSNCDKIGGCGENSPQIQWLKADLAANSATCTAAIFHHPLFSSGWHGNDTDLPTKAGPIWDALYDANADVVISGHDHDYERFAPQDPNGVADAAHGIREFVVGTGGTSLRSFETIKANSEVRDSTTHGVLKLTLHPSSYDWQFIPVAGKTFSDAGSGQCSGAPQDMEAPAAPSGLTAAVSQGGIALDWDNNTEADLAGYSVYRSTSSGGPYSKITSSLLTSSAYTDTKAKEGTTYYYVVSATDRSSNGSTYSNEASATAPLVALSFDGVDDWVSVPNSSLLNQSSTTARTYELDIKTGSDVSRRQFVYEEGGDGNGFSVEIDGGRVYFNAWSSGWSIVSASAPINPNTSYQVRGVYHQPSGQVSLYLDGVLQQSSTGARSMPQHADRVALGGIAGSTRSHANTSVKTGSYFSGLLEDFQALGGSGTIIHYPVDEGSGTMLNDSSPNNLDGTINGGASWVTDNTTPPSPSAVTLSFDGVNDWVSVPSSKLLNQTGLVARTYELDIKTGSDVSRRQFVYEEGGDGNGLSIEIDGGRLYFNAWSTTNGWGTVSASAPVAPNTSYDVAGVYDRSSGELRLYLDGALQNTSSGVGAMLSHGDGVAIGGISGSSKDHTNTSVRAGGSYFGGKVSEFAAWSQARTAAQVQSDSQGDLSGSESGLILLYKVDEGGGTMLNDSTANNLDGTINGASWLAS